MSEPLVKNIIENTLSQVYGAPLAIEAVVDENLEIAEGKLSTNGGEQAPVGVNDGNMLDNLLKTFGGKVVS